MNKVGLMDIAIAQNAKIKVTKLAIGATLKDFLDCCQVNP